MNEILGKLLSRLSKYDWFTTLLPGMFLLALIRRVGINASAESIIEELGLVFFLGVVSSRVGATCVEQIARWCKLFEPYEDYVDWSNANKENADMLVRNANWFRSLCGMVIVWGGLVMVKSFHFTWLTRGVKLFIAILVLLILFGDAYRRQLSFTTKRIRKFKLDKFAKK